MNSGAPERQVVPAPQFSGKYCSNQLNIITEKNHLCISIFFFFSEVITIVHPPITPVTGSSDDQTKAKKDLLETLAKEVGADSAKELLEILKQKVDEKNNPQILISTVAPIKTVDQKITDLKNKNPTTAKKIETVAKNPGILDKVKNLFGGGSKSSDGGGLFSGLLGGSGLMSMLPMLMPLLSGGGGPLSALMGGGKNSSPLSMITSMMGGGGGAGGLMSTCKLNGRWRWWIIESTCKINGRWR